METKIFVNLDEMKTIFYAKSGNLGFLKLHILLFWSTYFAYLDYIKMSYFG